MCNNSKSSDCSSNNGSNGMCNSDGSSNNDKSSNSDELPVNDRFLVNDELPINNINIENNKIISNIDNDLFYKLELLSNFLSGQKDIYLFSKNVMNFRQNCIMIFTVIIGSIATVLSIKERDCDENYLLIITLLNSLITILVGILGIFKFDIKGEAYLHISNGFNKLEMHIENSSSQLQIIKNVKEKEKFYLKQIKFVEQNIGYLKEDNNFIVPTIVFNIYPFLMKINIFKYIQLNNHLYNSNILTNDIEKNENVLVLLNNEIYDEILNADKYKSFWFIYYFYNKNNNDKYNNFMNNITEKNSNNINFNNNDDNNND
jgi:hypothetical protein